MRNNKKNNIIMREFLQKSVDWIAMLLRGLYAAPTDASMIPEWISYGMSVRGMWEEE